MASLHLGAALLINESWVVFGFKNKRFRRVAERWRFRVQHMSVKEQMTKHDLVRFAKRSESLRYILKQYGVSVENPQENKASSINFEETHANVPSTVIYDSSKMNTTEELPDLPRKEKYRETISTAENLSGKNHHNIPHLNTGALFTNLLPVLGFCIICVIGTVHRIISRNLEKLGGRKESQGHHHGSEERTRWRSALSDWNEPLASDEHDSSPENRVGSANQEAMEEVDEAYNRVELEYKRFLSECGVSES
ncbi:unnamed protein product [Arabis nemorensis]|uniref:Transmembrane protein n=1 Tax=Arabis nemorensis TaxID=586526 RepID=A0A565C4S7_9BRAS|nr:unnamed protein product [Arabis nemorensis]